MGPDIVFLWYVWAVIGLTLVSAAAVAPQVWKQYRMESRGKSGMQSVLDHDAVATMDLRNLLLLLENRNSVDDPTFQVLNLIVARIERLESQNRLAPGSSESADAGVRATIQFGDRAIVLNNGVTMSTIEVQAIQLAVTTDNLEVIAERLHLTPSRVDVLLQEATRKLGVDNVQDAFVQMLKLRKPESPEQFSASPSTVRQPDIRHTIVRILHEDHSHKALGFFVSADGAVIVPYYVVSNEQTVAVDWMGQIYQAHVERSSSETDTALLRVANITNNLRFLAPSNITQPFAGQKVSAYLYDGGSHAWMWNVGSIVSTTHASSDIGGNKRAPTRINDVVLADLKGYPGSSGAPIVDEAGRLVGILMGELIAEPALGRQAIITPAWKAIQILQEQPRI
ncbi:MAG TPA: serine protease [Chloroflexia bacterium]|jgi:hypothetical protein